MKDLQNKKCEPCREGAKPLSETEAKQLVSQLNGWVLNQEATRISKTFRFKNFLQTMSFVNLVAWLAEGEDHHPNLEVSYNVCKIHYSTHTVKGLSENDFICAAKIDLIAIPSPSKS